MKIGYIGLGAMGGALARRLVDRHSLTVLDLNSSVVERFVALGASSASKAAEIGRECEVVFLCLPRSSDVGRALFGPDGVICENLRVKLIIDQTSGVPTLTREYARKLAERGVGLLDAPVAGGVPAALAGSVTIMVSGARTDYESALSTLKEISPKVYYCGERVGNAQAAKLINNSINSGYRIATLEIAALAAKLGISLGATNEVLINSSAHNFTALRLFSSLLCDQPSTDFALSLMLKDVTQAIALGFDCRSPMPIAGAVRGVMQIAVNATPPGASLDLIVNVVEDMAAAKLRPPVATVKPEPVERRAGFGMVACGVPGEGLVAELTGGAVQRLEAGWLEQDDLPGVVVDFTRRSLAEHRQLSANLAERGVAVLDAATADLPGAIFFGGAETAFETFRPLMGAAAAKAIYCGPPGASVVARLVASAVAACNRAIVYENAAVGLKTGLDPQEMATVLNEGSGWSAEGKKIVEALAAGAPTSTVSLAAATEDLRALVMLGIEHGAPLLVASQVLALHETQQHRSPPDATVDALNEHFEKGAGFAFSQVARDVG